MEPAVFVMIREVLAAHGVEAALLAPPYGSIAGGDPLLQNLLYNNGRGEALRKLGLIGDDPKLFIITDRYGIVHMLSRLPDSGSGEEPVFFLAGPYMASLASQLLDGFIGEGKLSLSQIAALREYYAGVPLVPSTDPLEVETVVLLRHAFGVEDLPVARIRMDEADAGAYAPPETAEPIRFDVLEARYANEDALLDAVCHGDYQQAMAAESAFSKFTIERRFPDELRDAKNYTLAYNTLLRKAVQRADVHPAHIDAASGGFAKRIEAARSRDELAAVAKDMLRRYCLLVQNHSLRKFGRPVQKAINYIDFNYKEPITLDALAKTVGLNPCYLSSQFKKEAGISVIDYVNQSRIQRAQRMLVESGISIRQIAEAVGFADENYFTRMFKKHIGSAPSEYRKLYKA